MTKEPRVTIIMATYNRAHLIVETLISIQNQTYLNWECMIIDDGGTDNTKDALINILEKDQRIIYTNRPVNYQKGLPGCRNYGLDMAKGDYIIFFDDDDIVHPLNLELCVSILHSKDVSYCRYIRNTFTGNFDYKFDMQKEFNSFYIEEVDYPKMITGQLPFNSCAVMWKKECFENIRFNESLMYAEEWECYTRVLTSGVKGISINKILFFGRKHPNSNTGEFWNHDPVRMDSKVEACKLIIKNLSGKQLLTYRLGVYFISLALFLKNQSIFKHLMRYGTNFSLWQKCKLTMRYYASGIVKPLYKLKKKLAVTI